MKRILVVLLVLIAVGVAVFFVLDEPLPSGKEDGEAELLADKMLDAIGFDAWQNIDFLAFSFRGAHHYVWDKSKDYVEVRWDETRVLIDTKTVTGLAFKKGEPLSGKEKGEAFDMAWSYWCNDSFWLNAPAKIRDAGTTREIVEEDARASLLVRYSAGGVTPGDAYLWRLDEDGRPTSYKMWVSIIPLGGVEASWDEWEDHGGAQIATSHEMGPLTIPIQGLKSGGSLADLGLDGQLFDPLRKR